MKDYEYKYIKYKAKYDNLSKQYHYNINMIPTHDNGNGDAEVKRHLALLEYLNFEGVNKRNWDIIQELYDPDVTVVMPNGVTIRGFDKHLVEIKKMFDNSPDIKIVEQQVQFGSGDWTAVTQVMEGHSDSAYIDGANINTINNFFRTSLCSLIRWKNDRIFIEIVYTGQNNI